MIDIVPQLRALAANDPHADPACAEAAADEIEWLRGERNRLAAEHSKAQLAILPWIEQAGWLNAKYDIYTDALRRIGMPGEDVDCTKEGHMIAVLIARDALKEDV